MEKNKIFFDNIRNNNNNIEINENFKNIVIENIYKEENSKIQITLEQLKNLNILSLNNINLFIEDKNNDIDLKIIYIKLNNSLINLNSKNFKHLKKIKIGDWGLGIGDWGLGIGDWAQSPIPNPQF